MRIIGFSLALATACAFAAPAFAGDAKVAWNDLDTGTAAGKAELDRRIEAAAQQVCAPEAVTGSRLVPSRPSPACLTEARAEIAGQVAARIGHSQLAAGKSTGRTAGARR